MGIFTIITLVILAVVFLTIFILYKIGVFLFKGNKNKPKENENTILENVKKLNLDKYASFLGRWEIRELPKIISSNENITNIVQGRYNNGNGILVCTNIRLIFIDQSGFRLKVVDFPLDKISSIQCETQIIGASIKIHNSGNYISEIKQVRENLAREFCQSVNDVIALSKQQKPIILNNTSQSSVLDEIEKLARLRNSGILTEQEFNEQKKKMLEKI